MWASCANTVVEASKRGEKLNRALIALYSVLGDEMLQEIYLIMCILPEPKN